MPAPPDRGAVEQAYGAYLRDPDGNKIRAYCFGANDGPAQAGIPSII